MIVSWSQDLSAVGISPRPLEFSYHEVGLDLHSVTDPIYFTYSSTRLKKLSQVIVVFFLLNKNQEPRLESSLELWIFFADLSR